jgi:hypothetical protein
VRDQGLIVRAARAAALLVLLVAVAASVAGGEAAATAADPSVDRAVAALRSSYVYVDPGAQARLTDAEQQLLTNQISSAGTPIWLAVLPASVLAAYSGSGQAATAALAAATGQAGTFGVVIGPTAFFAVNNTGHPVSAIAAKAVQQNRAVFDVLGSFVTGVSDAFGSGAAAAGRGRSTNGGAVLSLLVLVAAGGGALLISSRRARKREAVRAAEQAAAAPEGPADDSAMEDGADDDSATDD